MRRAQSKVSLNWFDLKVTIDITKDSSKNACKLILGKSLKYEIETFRRFGKSCFLQTC